MFETELSIRREQFIHAVEEGDVRQAYENLLVLAEVTDDTMSEWIVLDSLSRQKQIAEDTCEDHGVWCCPECFDMEPLFDCGGDPVDDLDSNPLTLQLHKEVCESDTGFWLAECDDWIAQRDAIRGLPEVSS